MASSKSRGKLRVTAGAGEGREVSAEVADRYAGRPVRDALMGIVENEIRDPELRRMLLGPRLALEMYGGGEEGEELQEAPLSPNENWDRVIRELEKADVEVGISRSHAGGSRRY